jgi:ATP-dependent Clp protease protease subunit
MKLNKEDIYGDDLHPKKTKEADKHIDKLEPAFREIEFGINVEDSIIYLHGDIQMGNLFDFIAKVRIILANRPAEKEGQPITVLVNSDGGDVYEALGMIDYIKSLPVKVNMICRGRAMSAAALLLCATTGVRAASKLSTIMVHEISTTNFGKASDIKANADHVENLEDITFNILAEHSKQPDEFWRKHSRKDFYMSAEKALEYGLIDQII